MTLFDFGGFHDSRIGLFDSTKDSTIPWFPALDIELFVYIFVLLKDLSIEMLGFFEIDNHVWLLRRKIGDSFEASPMKPFDVVLNDDSITVAVQQEDPFRAEKVVCVPDLVLDERPESIELFTTDCVKKPVLVINSNHFDDGDVIYRPGMEDVYRITFRVVIGSIRKLITAEEFPPYEGFFDVQQVHVGCVEAMETASLHSVSNDQFRLLRFRNQLSAAILNNLNNSKRTRAPIKIVMDGVDASLVISMHQRYIPYCKRIRNTLS